MAEVVVSAKNIHKQFRPPHQAGSVKSIFTNAFRDKKSRPKPHVVLDGVSLDIKKGEFFGIVGRNGSGKSTMLKILAGIYQPTKGSLRVSGRLVPFIELGVGFNPELTGKDNVYLNGAILGFSKAEIDSMYESIVEFAELADFMDEKLKNYSSGMQVRLAFSMAIRADADILLIDEVLAVGDASFQKKCYDYFFELKQEGKTVVFISHDMDAVRTYCDRVALLESGNVFSIGSAEEIAAKYTDLFFPGIKSDGRKYKRRGNSLYSNETVDIHVDSEMIRIKTSGILSATLPLLVYGLHIRSEDGAEITAFNNRMLGLEDIRPRRIGRIECEWQISNVFATGKYIIDITFVDEKDVVVDWICDAATFSVYKKQHSTTRIMPDVKVWVSTEKE